MRTLIIDDERLARNELRRLLEKHPFVEIVGEASNADEALEKMDALQPDLIFLDIQMPGKTGFELLAELPGKAPDVIFTTAYDAYALKAFEFNATDYLLKPIDPKRLAEAVGRIDPNNFDEGEAPNSEANLADNGPLLATDHVFIKDGERCWFVKLNTIRLFESVGNYVRIHFDGQRALILRSLNALDERLDPKSFFRANRKHIINLTHIEGIEPYFNGGFLVKLRGDLKIEISRRQAVRFRELLSL